MSLMERFIKSLISGAPNRWEINGVLTGFSSSLFPADFTGLNQVTAWPAVVLNASLVGAVGFYKIVATANTAFTIPLPTNPTVGQEIDVMLENSSGGALGAITTPAGLALAAAWPTPANTKNRTVRLRCMSAVQWRELWRGAADVAN